MSRIVFAGASLLLVCTAALAQDYAAVSGNDRVSYVAWRNQKGTTVPIPVTDVTRLCGDMDGCTVRVGMYDWAVSAGGRVASRDFLLFYNPQNRNWRSYTASPVGGPVDAEGVDNNNTVEHVNNSWTCYMTDGEYSNSVGTDSKAGFGLLVWTQYHADCWLTIID